MNIAPATDEFIISRLACGQPAFCDCIASPNGFGRLRIDHCVIGPARLQNRWSSVAIYHTFAPEYMPLTPERSLAGLSRPKPPLPTPSCSSPPTRPVVQIADGREGCRLTALFRRKMIRFMGLWACILLQNWGWQQQSLAFVGSRALVQGPNLRFHHGHHHFWQNPMLNRKHRRRPRMFH